MKQNFSFIYKLLLVAGDTLALLGAFTLAYILRVTLDPRPVQNPVPALTYISFIATLLPLWLGIFSLLGLYTKRVYERRPKEAIRLFIGAVAGILLFVTFDFFSSETIFPAKLIPVYAALLSFFVLWVMRTVLRWLRLFLYRHDYGVMRVILVGSSDTTLYVGKYLHENIRSGLKIVAIVANKKYIFNAQQPLQYKSLATAIAETDPHAIIQTDSENVVKVYDQAIEHHLDYQFIPSHSALFTSRHSVELLGGFPTINVQTTPLIGYGRVLKRMVDIVGGVFGLIVFSPIILVATILLTVFDHGDPVYRQKRLTRFNKTVRIFKFRTYYHAYHRMTPEEGFIKLGQPELIKEYRANGDSLENDPRVSPIGKFLRRTSLDEILQLINVVKGDISLVGPRSLEPFELDSYEFKSLILSVKSGLTGLAQISGRRDISFEERRKLDMYYVQNWSIWLDIRIIVQTIYTVLSGRGAK
jgi:exopolysaccharide biosynthesis polyprenyl glycosylphosphotransferase